MSDSFWCLWRALASFSTTNFVSKLFRLDTGRRTCDPRKAPAVHKDKGSYVSKFQCELFHVKLSFYRV